MISLCCTIIACLTLITITLISLSHIRYTQIVLDRERWDKLLTKYVDIAYEVVYSKYILPFVASQVTFPIDDKDKHFVEASQVFLSILQQQLGKNIDIYYKIYGGKRNFSDITLSMFILRIQEDMINQVIKNNIQLTLHDSSEQRSTKESSHVYDRTWTPTNGG